MNLMMKLLKISSEMFGLFPKLKKMAKIRENNVMLQEKPFFPEVGGGVGRGGG